MDRLKIKTLIQQKNDNFRKNILYLAAKVERRHLHTTPSVSHISYTDEPKFYRLLEFVCELTNECFSEDNDPHNEHDFAFFNFEGERYFFKIDYFKDTKFKEGVEDTEKLNDKLCFRVLTLGEADDY